MPSATFACRKEVLQQIRTSPFELSICEDCLLGFASKHASAEELEWMYSQYKYPLPPISMGTSQYKAMVELISNSLEISAKIFEIGSLDGYLLGQLREKGFQNLSGVEPSPNVEEARKKGLAVQKGNFTKEILADQKYDAFVLMHVWEHLSDPFDCLKILLQHLTPEGKIFIEVPNFTGFQHEHLFYFNRPFIRRLCDEWNLGLEILESNETILRFALNPNLGKKEVDTSASPSDDREKVIRKVTEETRRRADLLTLLIHQLSTADDHTKFIWWGSGMGSVIILNQLPPSLFNQLGPRLLVTDGDPSRAGLFIPGVSLPIQPLETMRGLQVENLFIASTYVKEIRKQASELKIEAKTVTPLLS